MFNDTNIFIKDRFKRHFHAIQKKIVLNFSSNNFNFITFAVFFASKIRLFNKFYFSTLFLNHNFIRVIKTNRFKPILTEQFADGWTRIKRLNITKQFKCGHAVYMRSYRASLSIKWLGDSILHMTHACMRGAPYSLHYNQYKTLVCIIYIKNVPGH